MKSALEKADDRTLIVFDVEGVLITPTDEVLRAHNKPALKKFIQELCSTAPSQAQSLWKIVERKTKLKLQDPKWIEIIKSLQEKKIKMIGLFRRETRKIECLTRTAQSGFLNIQPLGIDFSKSFQEISPLLFQPAEGSYPIKTLATFCKGIIHAKNDPHFYKGELIIRFLNEIAARKAGIPWFHHYKVRSIDQGRPILKLTRHNTGWDYRTVLRNGVKEAVGPNFAGHYLVVDNGCGTSCQMNWIINTQTGKVLGCVLSNFGTDYRLDSSLLIANPTYIYHPGEDYKIDPEFGFGTGFYKVENDQIIKMKEIDLTKIAQPKERIEKVIYVDGDLKNLEDVQKTCQSNNISFTGILYKDDQDGSNQERVALQFQILKEKRQWLNDEQVEYPLKKKSSDKNKGRPNS